MMSVSITTGFLFLPESFIFTSRHWPLNPKESVQLCLCMVLVLIGGSLLCLLLQPVASVTRESAINAIIELGLFMMVFKVQK